MLPLYGQEVTFVLLCPLTRKNRPFGSRFSMIFRPNSQPFSGHPTHPGSQALWLECVPGGIINRQLNQRTLTTIPDWRLISVFIISSSSSIILIIIIIIYIYMYVCMYWLLHFTPFALSSVITAQRSTVVNLVFILETQNK